MFTLVFLYVFFYLFIFLSLLVVTFTQLPVYFLTHFSTTNFMVFLQKYKPSKNLFLWLLFSLTGLPPVGLFFIKFNIFFSLLYQVHIYVIVILFLFFFLNMLYYAQLFNFRNFKKELYTFLTPDIISVWRNFNASSGNFSTYTTYRFTLFIINVLFFLFASVIFFSDYFLIVNLM